MTTNVFDMNASVIASDSRWSYTLKNGELLHAVVYADDTGFDKIVIAEGACALFAGNSFLINEWKQWISSKNKVILKRPSVIDDFAMCIVNYSDGSLIFEHGQKITDDLYRFAGTGAKFAHTCWMNHKDPIKAVATASKSDYYSGGEIKFVKIKESSHNIVNDSEFDGINRAIFKRGMVMYPVYEGKNIGIHQAAEADPRISELMTSIASGKVSADAPSGRDPVVWTETDVKRLDIALEGFFGKIAK